MIIWITGQSGSGKTTLAEQMASQDKNIFVIDGDVVRDSSIKKIGFSKEARWKHNLNMANIAAQTQRRGFDVIVSAICPYKKLREEVQKITKCSFIYLDGGKVHKDYPYEYEKDKFYFKK